MERKEEEKREEEKKRFSWVIRETMRTAPRIGWLMKSTFRLIVEKTEKNFCRRAKKSGKLVGIFIQFAISLITPSHASFIIHMPETVMSDCME